MGGSNFDGLMQEIFKHRQVMEQLEEENKELRRQIADLREGRGISIEICGKRFSLAALTTASTRAIPTPAPVSYNTPAPAVSALITPTPQQTTILYEAEPDVTEAPTIAMPETPSSELIENEEEEEYTPTFLEEIMIDEFESASTAATSPMAVWSPPSKKQQNTEEEERAALRRQLIGSFLLE
jgi:hypothetical protein